MTALLVSAAGQVVGGATRWEWPLTVLTLPWLPFRVLIQGFMITFGASLPVRFALKTRGLYAIAAFIQTTLEGHLLIGVGVLAVVTATYWQPYAGRQVVLGQSLAGRELAAQRDRLHPGVVHGDDVLARDDRFGRSADLPAAVGRTGAEQGRTGHERAKTHLQSHHLIPSPALVPPSLTC